MMEMRGFAERKRKRIRDILQYIADNGVLDMNYVIAYFVFKWGLRNEKIMSYLQTLLELNLITIHNGKVQMQRDKNEKNNNNKHGQ